MQELTKSEKIGLFIAEFRGAAEKSAGDGANFFIAAKLNPDATKDQKLIEFAEAVSEIAPALTGTRYQTPQSVETLINPMKGREPAIHAALVTAHKFIKRQPA